MSYLPLVKQHVQQINQLLALRYQELSEAQILSFQTAVVELSDTITTHVTLTEQTETQLQQKNAAAYETRNILYADQKQVKAEEQNLREVLTGIKGKLQELEQQIDAQYQARIVMNAQRQRKLSEKADMEKKMEVTKYFGLIGLVAHLTGLTKSISNLVSEIAGINGDIRQLQDDIQHGLKEQSLYLAERSNLDQQVHQHEQQLHDLEIQIEEMGNQITQFSIQLQVLSKELVLTKALAHGLKALLLELNAANDKAGIAKILFEAFNRQNSKPLQLENKIISTLKEAFELLERALEQLPPQQEQTTTRGLQQAVVFESFLLGPLTIV